MWFHLIIDHPDKGSFNHAVMNAFIDGISIHEHRIDILDLNEDDFDPVMTVQELRLYPQGGVVDPKVLEYQRRLKKAEYLVLLFPIWWIVMPVWMKGWLDKVLLPGFAFTVGQFPQLLLTNTKAATIFTTTAVADKNYRLESHNALEWVLCEGTLKFIGIQNIQWFNFGEAGFASQDTHNAWLANVRNYAMQL